MSHFIKLQMFLEQNKPGWKSPKAAMPAPTTRPFSQWKVGYFVESSKSTASGEWKITQIDSSDGLMHNEDCTVTLQNADETRVLKGSSLRSSYQFVSVGDVVEEKAPAAPTDAPTRDDVQFMVVNIASIREFYPRTHGEGTRVVMADKTAYIVADGASEVAKMITAVGGVIAGTSPPVQPK